MAQVGSLPAAATAEPGSASASTPASSESSQPKATPAMTTQAERVHEIDLDLAQGGHENVTMTVRLAGDKLGVVIRAASAATASAIEGTRDAIAERLAAIGQPVSSLIIQQTGANDATGAAGQSASGDGDARQRNDGDASDPRGARRGASRF
jgi:Flagellar hook-length control protein FliK